MPILLTRRHLIARFASCVVLWLATLLWSPVCVAATSQIVEQAFVLDPGGQMTLEQARQQPQTAFTGAFKHLHNRSVVWVRLRVVPPAATGAVTGVPMPATEQLRVVPMWSQSLSLYDPLLLDAGGPTYLKADVLTAEDAATRDVSDSLMQDIVIGVHAILVLLGVVAWVADPRGIGHAMFSKQVFNVMLAVLNADLFLMPVLPGVLQWAEGIGTYGLEGFRLLNLAASLWFFIKVLGLLQAPRWAAAPA